MRKGGICLLAVLSVAACVLAASALAITGNAVVDGNAHPAVGDMLDLNTFEECSGTLVKADGPYDAVFVTAAHCVENGDGSSAWGAPVQVTFDSTRTQSSTFYSGTFYGDPAFNQSLIGGSGDSHDLAVVVLSLLPKKVKPVRLAPVGSAGTVGTNYTIVGYGVNNPFGFDNGIRRSAVNSSTGVNSFELQLGPTGTWTGTTCSGDSGGPELLTLKKSEYLAATTSYGTDGCSVGYDHRVDTAAARAFINQAF